MALATKLEATLTWFKLISKPSFRHPTPVHSNVCAPPWLGDRVGWCLLSGGAVWCLLFVLIRQGLRGGSGPPRLIRAPGIETGNPIMTFEQRSSFLSFFCRFCRLDLQVAPYHPLWHQRLFFCRFCLFFLMVLTFCINSTRA